MKWPVRWLWIKHIIFIYSFWLCLNRDTVWTYDLQTYSVWRSPIKDTDRTHDLLTLSQQRYRANKIGVTNENPILEQLGMSIVSKSSHICCDWEKTAMKGTARIQEAGWDWDCEKTAMKWSARIQEDRSNSRRHPINAKNYLNLETAARKAKDNLNLKTAMVRKRLWTERVEFN